MIFSNEKRPSKKYLQFAIRSVKIRMEMQKVAGREVLAPPHDPVMSTISTQHNRPLCLHRDLIILIFLPFFKSDEIADEVLCV